MKRIILNLTTFIATLSIGSIVSASDDLFYISTRDMGITRFDYSIQEMKREPRVSILKIPRYHEKSAGAYRWMMCAYTKLAIKRGFKFWAEVYPKEESDEIRLGFPEAKTEDLTKTLGLEFTDDVVLIDSINRLSELCYFEPDNMEDTPDLKPVR